MLFFQQKYVSFVFYLSLSPFCLFELRWPAAHFHFPLSFSCSIFLICAHDNLSKLKTLDNTDTESISAFRFRLYWLFCCLCSTRRRWLCDFPPKHPRVAFGLPYLLIELFYIAMPMMRTDGLSVYGHVITKFSRMGTLLHFLTHGAQLARFARESSSKKGALQ